MIKMIINTYFLTITYMKRSFLYPLMLIMLTAFPFLLKAQQSKPPLDHSVYDVGKRRQCFRL